MTRDEASALSIFLAEFREFRIDDREWKQDVDRRLALVEDFVTSERAVAEREEARGVSRRAYVASVIAAAGVLATVGGIIVTVTLNVLRP